MPADGIVQGDIAVSKADLRQSRRKRAATAFNKRLWREGVIPFQIADGVYTGKKIGSNLRHTSFDPLNVGHQFKFKFIVSLLCCTLSDLMHENRPSIIGK